MAHTMLPIDQYNSPIHSTPTALISFFLSSFFFVFPFIVSIFAAAIILG
jgi:hypothetical protein